MSSDKAESRAAGEQFVRGRLTWGIYGLVGYFAYLETVLGPLMPFLRAEHGYSYTVASLHFSAFASGGVIIGLLGDRMTGLWGRRTSLWGGGAGMAAGAVLLAASPEALGTILGALFMGISGSLLLITTQSVLSDRHGRHGAAALVESNAAASACAILASLAVGALASSVLGWRAALFLPIPVLVLLAIRFHAEPLGDIRGEERPEHEQSPMKLSLRFWACLGVVSLGVAVEWCVTYWGAEFLNEGAGLGRSEAASALSVFLAAMLTGRLLGSRLTRRLTSTTLLVLTLVVALAGFPVFWLSGAPGLNLLGLFVTGLGVGSVYPLAISAGVAAVPKGKTEVATARLALGASGAILLAPFLLGALADHAGIGKAYGIVPPMLLAAVLLMLVVRRSSP